MTFSGTVLIANVGAKVEMTGDVKKEAELKKSNRTVYHGTGKLVLDGSVRAVQWFGHDLKATWKGSAIIRLFGEFDKDLNTGTYWYEALPDQRKPWYTGGMSAVVPMPENQRPIVGIPKSGN